MGTTPTPLRILVVGLDWDDPAFAALRDQGHWVARAEEALEGYDLIMGPRCWRLIPEHMEFLPLALKEARAYARAARPKVTKKKEKKRGTTEA